MNDTNQVTRCRDIIERLLKYAERSTQGYRAIEQRQLHDAAPDLFTRPNKNQRDAANLFSDARAMLLMQPLMGPLSEDKLHERICRSREQRQHTESESSAARNLSTSGRGL
jgi:hypothetical protein